MKLVPIAPEGLIPGQPLPFSLRDVNGRVLVHRGSPIADEQQLGYLLARSLFVDANEKVLAQRQLNAQVDQMFRMGDTTLGEIAAIRPDYDLRSVPANPAERPLEWPDLEGRARVLLGDSRAARWEGRLDELADEILARLDRQVDATLLRFIHMAGTRPEDYSTHHAILVMLLCALAGPRLPGWQPEWRRPLTRAALSMNIGMVPLQNELVRQAHPLTPVQRAQVDAHALRGVELLQAAGVDDALWLGAVRHHHVAPNGPLGKLEPAMRLARLIQRADRYAARLSARRNRAALSAKAAAQAAFFDEGGHPDEAGQALLAETGLHPPGAWVKLACGEIALVMKRQPNPRAPLTVVSLVNRDGLPLAVPAVRHTALPKFKVEAGVPSGEVRVQPQLEALQKLV
ncbi:phosphohydrolase [Ideonella sp.]|uniref:HD-GYP domain-containing protein n=1 Tax=Ideonella sp. TaxID=1929293 RepID=UPI002B4A1A3E|nr:phosphohydrolase [Ideonella sp.]HJV69676.1 phosphohydrolase [Ideonella sp.]